MGSKQCKKVIQLRQWDAERALADLNRITGLQFASWPESLVEERPGETHETDEGVVREAVLPCAR
ncbi:hypothetical protein JQX08_03520 [Pseudomonas sp. UL073]|uniref:Uncharacterized protein n=1 Tax=Zestomonas insulae TaxID=2809017 RepID=A0ABS2I9G9_9GAMM|nr:hypothetical protein [Pseudomonas insulae]MBM7059764.1 hypothetical protein [Pseudomonas insulae]